MTHSTRFIFAACMSLCLLLSGGCKRTPQSDVNVELKDHPTASRIICPGMGTVGLIRDGQVEVFFINEEYVWDTDPRSTFQIPEDNNGLLAMGNGIMGVVRRQNMEFYRLSTHFEWVMEENLRLHLPGSKHNITAVRMPWEMGLVAFEWNNYLEFYYHNGASEWIHDETASFAIPPGIDGYFSLGSMTVAVIDGNKLGVYYLHPEGGWVFLEDYVLKLPEEYEAILPFEPGVIVVLTGNRLDFYALDTRYGGWVLDEEMTFYLPAGYL